MKKNTLYSVNKHNRDAFARYLEEENKNIFWPGGPMFEYNPEASHSFGTGIYATPVVDNVLTTTNLDVPDVTSSLAKMPSVSDLAAVAPKVQKTSWANTPQGQQAIGVAGQIASSILSPAIGKAVSGGYSSGAGSTISSLAPAVGAAVSMIPGVGALAGPIASLATSAVGALTNRAIGTKRNEKNISALKNAAGIMRSVGSTIDNSTDALRGRMRNFATKINFNNKGDLVKSGFLNRKKGIKESNNLLAMQDAAEAFQNNSIGLSLDNIAKGIGGETYLDSFAYGGPLFGLENIDPSTAIGYDLMMNSLTKNNSTKSQDSLQSPLAGVSLNSLAEGGKINIKHPGRLTALKKRTGKTEAQLWAEGKPEVRKMITFARNARKWKKAYGGYLDATNNLFAEGGLLNEDNLYALGGESFPSDMTLDEAYEKAREKGQEYFYFNGKRYSTGLTADTKTYAEGGQMETSQEITQEEMEGNETSIEDIPQEQGNVPREESVEEQEPQETEEEPQEELPELGEVLDITLEEAEELKAMGYEFKVIKEDKKK